MALRPGRQRSSATLIIAKGVVYPLQNRRASKLTTHGFASKSATRHNTKGTPCGVPFVLAGVALRDSSAPLGAECWCAFCEQADGSSLMVGASKNLQIRPRI